MRTWLTALFVLLGGTAVAAPVPVILDTDIFADVDDVGALTVLHSLSDEGKAQLLGVIVDTPSKWGAPCVDAIDTYFGRPDLPVGTLKPNDDSTSSLNYPQTLAQNFPNSIQDGNNAPDAVTVYRQLLAAQPDASVTVIGVGTLTVLEKLLDSAADSTSALTGKQLLAKKVAHLVLMGGAYPSGSEFNFQQNPGATSAVVTGWPTAMVFDGFEVGNTIATGSTLTADVPSSSPVRRAYEIYVGAGNSRPSWDPTAALFAVLGTNNTFAYAGTGGHNVIAMNGSNSWQSGTSSTQVYLTKSASDATIAALLETLIEHQPEPVPDAGTAGDGAIGTESTDDAGTTTTQGGDDASAIVSTRTQSHPKSGCSMAGPSSPSVAWLLLLALAFTASRGTRRSRG